MNDEAFDFDFLESVVALASAVSGFIKWERLSRGLEQGQSGEIGAKIAAINRGEAIGLGAGVGGDEEVRDEMLARSAFAPVAQKHLAS